MFKMKFETNKTKTAPAMTFPILRAKNDVLPTWASKVKATTITVDGKKIPAYANQEKSDYIYFELPSDHDGFKVRCFWGKDKKMFEAFLKGNHKMTGVGRTYKPRAAKVEEAAAPKAKAPAKKKASKKGNPKADSKGTVPAPKKQGIKVIKKGTTTPVTPAPAAPQA